MSDAPARKRSALGERILAAIEAEGRTQTSTESVLVSRGQMSRGQLSSLVSGRRGSSVTYATIAALAHFLHVEVEWLGEGKGPMRREGRGATPAEEAFVFARRHGAREDAIAAAWARHQDREATMSATDWVLAIDTEARQLDRAGLPRPNPEAELKAQASIRRQKSKLERARHGSGEHAQVVDHPPIKRAARGGV